MTLLRRHRRRKPGAPAGAIRASSSAETTKPDIRYTPFYPSRYGLRFQRRVHPSITVSTLGVTDSSPPIPVDEGPEYSFSR